MATRIVVCIDTDNDDTLEQAYEHVYKALHSISNNELTWESSDEWFDSDGVEIPEHTISATRLAVLQRLNH